MTRIISAVIPAYNEEGRIGDTIQALRETGKVQEIIVVDDGSTDHTAAEAKGAGARVISLPRNMGKGQAANAGVAASRGEIILLLDGDLGDTARETVKLLVPVLNGQADLTVAAFTRLGKRGGGFGLVKNLARLGIYLYTGRKVAWPLSGQRAFRCEVYQEAGPFAPGFGLETAFTIRALQRGFRLMEVPVAMEHRVTGWALADIRHRAMQFLAVAKVLLLGLRRPAGR